MNMDLLGSQKNSFHLWVIIKENLDLHYERQKVLTPEMV